MPRTRKQLWRKKGRPRKPAYQRRTVRITFNVTPKEAATIKWYAKNCKMTMPDYLRYATR